jgi:hypothetical protein
MATTGIAGERFPAAGHAITSQRSNGTPMSLTLVLAAAMIVLGVTAIITLAILADRSSRATAWQQIALERRWNHEQHRQHH